MARTDLARRALAALRASAAELAVGAAFIAGWLLVTAAVAELLPPRVVWLASLGLLLVCAGGLRFFADLVWQGLYVLTREAPALPRKVRVPGPRRVS